MEVAPQQATPLLPTLAQIAALNHFPQARNLQETIWKQLGCIMLTLGKRVGSNLALQALKTGLTHLQPPSVLAVTGPS